jgi:phenylpyruvate tautomerase PptA (4-oxalocrotonate tautomerase family)
MPFVHTRVHKDFTALKRKRIVDGVHLALVDSIGMPADEMFNLVTEYQPGQFWCNRTLNGTSRSDRVVIVEITLQCGRDDAMKRELYAAITRNLENHAEMPPQDIFVFIRENDYSGWAEDEGKFTMALAQ